MDDSAFINFIIVATPNTSGRWTITFVIMNVYVCLWLRMKINSKMMHLSVMKVKAKNKRQKDTKKKQKLIENYINYTDIVFNRIM